MKQPDNFHRLDGLCKRAKDHSQAPVKTPGKKGEQLLSADLYFILNFVPTAQIAAANLAGANRGANGPPRPRKTVTPRPPVSSVSDALVSKSVSFIAS